MHPQYTARIIARFWSQVDMSGDCWLWTGWLNPGGYGVAWDGHGHILTHRFSFILSVRPLGPGECACHDCDINYPLSDRTWRRCCRPEHLFPGTKSDNSLDMYAKHRQAVRIGERNPHAVLTEELVNQIRAKWAAGGISQTALAREVGVTSQQIGHIVRRHSWRHN